jgi:colanic acid/amylovoran biosynthesis glycosyltransferase
MIQTKELLLEHRPTSSKTRVAYMMSRFPKLTETFILYEILAVEAEGALVEIYPLMREKTTVMHPEAKPLVKRAHYQPFISLSILHAHAYFLRHKPGSYLKTLWDILRGTWGSFRFLTGAVFFFPKSVYFAYAMQRDEITHVHAHFASHPAVAALIIHRLTGIPYSFTGHGSDLHRDRRMLRQKVAEAAVIIAVSNFNKDVILRECGEEFADKIMVLHCGADTEVFQKRTQITRKFTQDTPFNILCIGTLHEVKGQTYLIEACRVLRDHGLSFVCTLIGDGPDLEALQTQTQQHHLESFVQFSGRKTHAQVAAALQEADVVVAPSVPSSDGRREGIPVVLMEAMASGIPVIASDLSGIPELVISEKTGLLTPPGDAVKVASALERLYTDWKLRQWLGDAGRDKVLTEFDLQKNAAQLVKLFQAKESLQ